MPRKPSIAIRRPPPDPALVRFVEEGAPPKASQTAARAAIEYLRTKPRNNLVTRADGRQVQRLTVYLPPELVRRLRMRCVELELDLSAGLSCAAQFWVEEQKG